MVVGRKKYGLKERRAGEMDLINGKASMEKEKMKRETGADSAPAKTATTTTTPAGNETSIWETPEEDVGVVGSEEEG